MEHKFRLQNMSIGRQLKKNKTDIIFVYKILYYMYIQKTCRTRCALAIKSGAGMKTSRLLDGLIENNIIRENKQQQQSQQDDNNNNNSRVDGYEITRYGEQVYEDLDNLLTVLNTDILPPHKKENIKLITE